MASRFPVGGIRMFIRYVYSQQAFNDCDITFLAPDEHLGDYLAQYIPAERFRVQVVPRRARELFFAMRVALQAKQFDLFHSHGLKTGVLAELARIGTNTPHLMTMHDMFLPSTFQGIRGRVRQLALNSLLQYCDAIHAVGQDCAENCRTHLPWVRMDKFHAIRNGIDTQRLASATAVDAHLALGLPRETVLIGFFGRFMAPKGFRTLVNAIAILVRNGLTRPIKVVTFGWGGFIREDYQYLRQLGLGNYFLQHPHTDEPHRWMKAMDVIAMPSRWEACGLVAMEALTVGTAIVGTTCIGLREVLHGSPAATVNPDDAEGFALAIKREIESPRKQEFEEYSALARESFDVRICGAQIRELYGQLV